MKTIHFKSGHTLEITDNMLKGIIKTIDKGGKFQTFVIKGDKVPSILINIFEIEYIK